MSANDDGGYDSHDDDGDDDDHSTPHCRASRCLRASGATVSRRNREMTSSSKSLTCPPPWWWEDDVDTYISCRMVIRDHIVMRMRMAFVIPKESDLDLYKLPSPIFNVFVLIFIFWSARQNNLDHIYIGKYALWTIRRPIKPPCWPHGTPLYPPWPLWTCCAL